MYRLTTGATKITSSSSSGGLFSYTSCPQVSDGIRLVDAHECHMPGDPGPYDQNHRDECVADGVAIPDWQTYGLGWTGSDEIAARQCISCSVYRSWWNQLFKVNSFTCGVPPPPPPPSCFSSEANVQVPQPASQPVPAMLAGSTLSYPNATYVECSSRMASTSAWMRWPLATASSPLMPPRVSGTI